ncbi:hypothetical protein EPUL_002290, partial [Erysiphe pulchra]
MEILEDTNWDLIISGTGLRRSLLSLALSRSNKKILHIDPNPYYGDTDAALSLDEVKNWVDKYRGPEHDTFRNACLQETNKSDDLAKIFPSRSYTLTLSPFIIYSKSNLLSKLISSNAYRQLEFQAVGNWWIIDSVNAEQKLQKIPNGREDIFQDNTIDNRSKRNLMKFLRFVMDYENQINIWKAYSEKPLHDFLSSQFSIPSNLQKVIAGLTLTLNTPDQTVVSWALPRIFKHLSSIGTLGPFCAVVSKWGCGAEISQIACRAGAVGGTIYMLGTGIEAHNSSKNCQGLLEVRLTNGCVVKTKHLLPDPAKINENSLFVSRLIAITTSSYQNLLKSNVDGTPPPAVVVVVFPSGSLIDKCSTTYKYPVYIMIHSSDTGECPDGQYLLYATTLSKVNSKNILETALIQLSKHASNSDGIILYSLYYEFSNKSNDVRQSHDPHEQHVDLAFDDKVINEVEAEWQEIMGSDGKSETFMNFDDRDSS